MPSRRGGRARAQGAVLSAERGAVLDAREHAHYGSIDGTSVSRAVHPRPLSWRVRGQECLVADRAGAATASRQGSYTLSVVEPKRA